MTYTVTQQMLDEIVATIVKVAAPVKIILFGSRATAAFREDSDLDLLIVVKEPFGPQRSRRDALHRIRDAVAQFRVPKDILVYSQEEADYWAQSLNHILAVAMRQGIVLYEGHSKS